MANGHRLEKLFSKRKSTLTQLDPVSNAQPPPEPLFPSPSFIRPKSSRMMARDEIGAAKSPTTPPSRRTRSLPEPRGKDGLVFNHRQKPSGASITLELSPKTSAPPLRRREAFISGFYDFQFPIGSRPSREESPISLPPLVSCSSHLLPGRDVSEQRREDDTCPSARVDTPPPSDEEDFYISSESKFRHKKLPALPPGGIPTPAPSPEMAPISDSRLSDPRVTEILHSALYNDIQHTLDTAIARVLVRKSSAQPGPESRGKSARGKTVLKEPSFNDFCDLSDDDIAEAVPETLRRGAHAELPLTPPDTILIPSPHRSSDPSLLTLAPPPFASRPATAAAFEAARIAARYNFDLVYVVNLWPGTDDCSGLPSAKVTESSLKAAFLGDYEGPAPQADGHLTGRLLAAYGLDSLKCPFRISTAVHSKILQADGWIEYRNHEAHADEFARGFARAFYSSQHVSRPPTDSPRASSNGQCQGGSRGIVFAAYRKPQEAGKMKRAIDDVTDLEAVHRDAEAFVEMLIDIHAANRSRQSAPDVRHSDETGPMPVQRLGVST